MFLSQRRSGLSRSFQTYFQNMQNSAISSRLQADVKHVFPARPVPTPPTSLSRFMAWLYSFCKLVRAAILLSCENHQERLPGFARSLKVIVLDSCAFDHMLNFSLIETAGLNILVVFIPISVRRTREILMWKVLLTRNAVDTPLPVGQQHDTEARHHHIHWCVTASPKEELVV